MFTLINIHWIGGAPARISRTTRLDRRALGCGLYRGDKATAVQDRAASRRDSAIPNVRSNDHQGAKQCNFRPFSGVR